MERVIYFSSTCRFSGSFGWFRLQHLRCAILANAKRAGTKTGYTPVTIGQERVDGEMCLGKLSSLETGSRPSRKMSAMKLL